MSSIVLSIRQDLNELADEALRTGGKLFFKEDVTLYGVRTARVQRMAREYWLQINGLPKTTILGYCEELWQSGFMEEAFIACSWSNQIHKRYTPEDFETLERWVSSYVSNWATCDTLSNHTVGNFVQMYPQFIQSLRSWTASPNRWLRRSAAVSLIVPARRGLFLDDILGIATLLLTDKDDLVQKGYGWMLKVASQAHPNEVFTFIMGSKTSMPRTALRYAIEKMPKELRKLAMER